MRINQPVTKVEHRLEEGAYIVSTTDLRGVITYGNEEFIRISGFSREELIGQPQNVVRHPDMPQRPSKTCGAPSRPASPGRGWSRTGARTGISTGWTPM